MSRFPLFVLVLVLSFSLTGCGWRPCHRQPCVKAKPCCQTPCAVPNAEAAK